MIDIYFIINAQLQTKGAAHDDRSNRITSDNGHPAGINPSQQESVQRFRKI